MLRMPRYMLTMILALACAGCAGLPEVTGQGELPEPMEPVQVRTRGGEMIQTRQPMIQTSQTRGQFDLVAGQGRIVNGFVRIPALVHNRSEHWADVIISVQLLDAAGQLLVNRAATTAGEQMRSVYAVPPGGVMCYLYLRDVERLSGRYAGHRLALRDAYASAPAGTAQVTLTDQFALTPAFDGAPTYLARGTVTSAAGCAVPLVVAGGFDAAGNLLDVAESPVYPKPGLREFGSDLDELTPGGTGHFTLEFFVPGIQSIRAIAVCR